MEANEEIGLEERIVERLARGAKRNELVEEVVLERGLTWNEAEVLVERVAQDHALRIASRQMPYGVLLSLILIIGGLILVAISVAPWADTLWRALIERGNAWAAVAEALDWKINLPRFGLGVILGTSGIVFLRRSLRKLKSSWD